MVGKYFRSILTDFWIISQKPYWLTYEEDIAITCFNCFWWTLKQEKDIIFLKSSSCFEIIEVVHKIGISWVIKMLLVSIWQDFLLLVRKRYPIFQNASKKDNRSLQYCLVIISLSFHLVITELYFIKSWCSVNWSILERYYLAHNVF